MVLLDWNDMESDSPSKEFGVFALAGRHIADYRHCDHFRSAYRLGMRYLSQ